MPQGTGNNGSGNTTHQVVDFNQVRTQKLDEKRRKTERIFFKQLLSVYCVTEDSAMRAIEPVDVSEEGFSFQVPYNPDKPWPTDANEFTIRLYFSQETYIPVLLRIVNSRPCIESGARYVRFGCTVDQTLTSYPAYAQFVRFMKAYSEHAHKDAGDMTLFYI